MNEITEQNLVNLIKEKFPKFLPYWQAYFNKWGSDAGIGDDMEPFVHYIVDEIRSENYHEVEEIFNHVEFLLCNGDELVQVVVENCVLIPLMYKSRQEIEFVNYSKFLGTESINFLKTWLKFECPFYFKYLLIEPRLKDLKLE